MTLWTICALTVAVAIALFDLWALLSVFRSDKPLGVRLGWAAVIVALPVIGLAAWGKFGPRAVVEPPSSPEHSKG